MIIAIPAPANAISRTNTTKILAHRAPFETGSSNSDNELGSGGTRAPLEPDAKGGSVTLRPQIPQKRDALGISPAQ